MYLARCMCGPTFALSWAWPLSCVWFDVCKAQRLLFCVSHLFLALIQYDTCMIQMSALPCEWSLSCTSRVWSLSVDVSALLWVRSRLSHYSWFVCLFSNPFTCLLSLTRLPMQGGVFVSDWWPLSFVILFMHCLTVMFMRLYFCHYLHLILSHACVLMSCADDPKSISIAGRHGQDSCHRSVQRCNQEQ